MSDDPRLVHLREQRDAALADIRELEAQVEAGEIDSARADELRIRYEAAAADAIAALHVMPDAAPRDRTRALLGIAVFAVAAVAVVITLIAAVEPRPEGGFVTGGVAADVVEQTPVDLAAVSNDELEAVVAANPEILPMRLALARRYVEAGQFSEALGHYLYVLDRRTDPEALMYVGWMTYLSGDATTGVAFLEESLTVRPDDTLAQWFLANALYFGTNDVDRAVPLLETVIDSGVAPDDIVTEAQRMIDEASA